MTEEDLDEFAESQMTFGDHLEELRGRIFKALGFLLAAFVVIFIYREPILKLVVKPYLDVAKELRISPVLNTFAPAASFLAYLKVSMIVAAMVAAPLWMYQFWAFIGAGLYSHEKKVVYKFAPPMLILFAGGVLFGYHLLIPIGLQYLLSFQDPTVLQNWIGLSEYLTLFTTLTLVLGLVFQLPIVMALFSKLEFVSPELFRAKRRFFILGAFIVSALLTPPDVITQVLMAVPLAGLYELGIFLSWLSQGENRAPVSWKAWRGRIAAAVVLMAVLGYFQGELAAAYRERVIGQKLHSAPDPADAPVPYITLCNRSGLFDFEPRHAFRVLDEADGELWCIGGVDASGARARLVRMAFESDRITRTGYNDDSATFTLNSTTQSVELTLIPEMAATGFGPLVTSMEHATAEDAVVLEGMVAALVGARPEGLSGAPDAASIEQAVAAWRRWWDLNHATFVHKARK